MIDIFDGFFFDLKFKLVKFLMSFSNNRRIQVYVDLISHLKSSDVDTALTSLQVECEKLGALEGILYEDIQNSMTRGNYSFFDSISKWFPEDETLQISVSKERSEVNGLVLSIESALDLCRKKRDLKSTYITKGIYPCLLLMVSFSLLVSSKYFLYDVLVKTKPFERWELKSQISYGHIDFISTYSPIILVLFFLFVFYLARYMKHGTGELRSSFNVVPPFSIYRNVTSYTLLVTLASLTKSGVQLKEALILIRDSISGWSRDEISLIIYKLENADNLPIGQTLTEYAFDSELFSKYVRVKLGSYSKRPDFVENLDYLNSVIIGSVSKQTLRDSAIASAVILMLTAFLILKIALIFLSVVLTPNT